MKIGRLILWNAFAICEMLKTSWQTGQHLMKGDSENLLKAQRSLLVQWLSIIRSLHETRRGDTVVADIVFKYPVSLSFHDIHSCVGSWPEHFRVLCDLESCVKLEHVHIDRPSSKAIVPQQERKTQ